MKSESFTNAPTFLIIGAQKAGTTALFSLLAQHPKILAPKEKEINFFQDDKNFSRGYVWYHEQFPPEDEFSSGQVTFEATPGYLYRIPAAQRIYEYNQSIKLIMLVRDPVERAYSSWNMYKNFSSSTSFRHLTEQRSFEEAIGQEFAELESGHHVHYKGFERQENCNMPFPGYISRGLYYTQLMRYLKLFDPSQILVVHDKDLKKNKIETLARILDFLNLEKFTVQTPMVKAANEGHYASEINYNIAQLLKAFYKPYNEKLYHLIGTDYAW